MSLLLVDEDDAVLRRTGERFVVSQKALDYLSVRSGEIDTIILAGRVEVTRAAIDLAMTQAIPIYLTTGNGRLRGSIQPPLPRKPLLRELQYQAFNNAAVCTDFARACVSAQITNQRALLRRLAIDRDAPALVVARAELKELFKTVKRRTGVEELRGVEGHATHTFYDGIRSILDPSLGFTVRAIRSDKDPFNCCLDALGGLLAQSCRSAVEAAGLDPFKGVLHGSSRNAPALALDLEDIYRPVLVMSTAVSLFTKKVLSQDDFSIKDQKCTFTKEGFRKLNRQFGNKLRSEVTRDGEASPATHLKHVFTDARTIASWINRRAESAAGTGTTAEVEPNLEAKVNVARLCALPGTTAEVEVDVSVEGLDFFTIK